MGKAFWFFLGGAATYGGMAWWAKRRGLPPPLTPCPQCGPGTGAVGTTPTGPGAPVIDPRAGWLN